MAFFTCASKRRCGLGGRRWRLKGLPGCWPGVLSQWTEGQLARRGWPCLFCFFRESPRHVCPRCAPLCPHPQDVCHGFGQDGAAVFAARAGASIPQHPAHAGVAAHCAGIGAAPLRRPEGHARARGPAGQLAAQGGAHRRNPVHRGARGAARLHRRAAAGRSGGHALGRRAPGARSAED